MKRTRNKGKEENKKKFRISIFYVLVSLFLMAIVIVIYINNIIAVNQLAVQTNEIKGELNSVKQTNDFLRTEMEKLTSYERIKMISAEKLNLTYSDTSIDESSVIVLKKSDLK